MWRTSWRWWRWTVEEEVGEVVVVEEEVVVWISMV